MLRRYSGGKTVGTPESDIARLDAARHVQSFGCRVDDLINGLHGKVESHKFALDLSELISEMYNHFSI
jgi:predicted LPLAT superfamily acyltransferase